MPHLFQEELRRAIRLLPEQPSVGKPALDLAVRGVRRLLLRASRYLVYYSVHDDAVEVLRLWHTSRGSKPPL